MMRHVELAEISERALLVVDSLSKPQLLQCVSAKESSRCFLSSSCLLVVSDGADLIFQRLFPPRVYRSRLLGGGVLPHLARAPGEPKEGMNYVTFGCAAQFGALGAARAPPSGLNTLRIVASAIT